MKKLVLGMGITGMALARFLLKRGLPFDGFDDRKSAAELKGALGAEVSVFADPEAPLLDDYDEVIVSPGPRQDHPLLVRAREAGLAIVAEVEFAFRYHKGTVIGITGSNGKSTTTSLIHHLLDGAGRKASLCGNIGVPFIARVDDDPAHIYVLELSSFQLENVVDFRPDVGVLLNISPDHLDWHGGFEGYQRAKLRLFAQQQGEDLAVVPAEFVDAVPGAARRLVVPSEQAWEKEGQLGIGADFRLDAAVIPLLGRHNRANVLFACAVVEQMGMGAREVAAILPSFKGLEHRMEPVGTWQGRLWINDTKATNVHACQAAVDALDQPYVLIMGGCDKGERFDTLDLSRNPPKAIVAYGETASKIVQDLGGQALHHIHLFKDAVMKAHGLAGEGGAVLLAPACASFDQFENFAIRGKVFKQLFKECVVRP